MDNQLKDRPENIQGKSNYLWLIDAGHGGMDKGKYTTAPAKMFTFPDGLTIYEGVTNRHTANAVAYKLLNLGIDYAFIHDEVEDTSLYLRSARADNWYAKDKRAVFVSIHSNSGGGSGFEIFTSKGQTKSDKIANIFCETYQKVYYDIKFRMDQADGDADKEADFYVLRKTDCPAILLENFFFDNRAEAEMLLSDEGINELADTIVQAIVNCEKLKPI